MRPHLLLVSLALLACGPAPEAKAPAPTGQTFPEAITLMCDVDKQASLSGDADPLGIGQKRTEWISAHVENPDGIELRTLLSAKGAAEQAEMLRDKAKNNGIATCALADALAKDGSGGLSP